MRGNNMNLIDDFLEETPGYDISDVEYEHYIHTRVLTVSKFGTDACVGNFDGFISSNMNVTECDGRGEYNIVESGQLI